MADLRIVVVAGDPLVRAGLAAMLSGQPGCSVVGRVPGEESLPEDVAVFRPDVVLWDLGWPIPGRDGPGEQSPTATLPATDRAGPVPDLAEIRVPVVALLADESSAAQVWAAGVRGLLPRDASVEVVVAALQAVIQGLVVIDPSFAADLLSGADRLPGPLVEELTPREMEVLQLLAEGLPNKAIARRLGISDHTVKFHVNAILGKLGAQSRTEAVVRATRLGLLIL